MKRFNVFKLLSLILITSLVTLGSLGVLDTRDALSDSGPKEIPGWYLTWNDEFEGDVVDESKWVIEDAALVKNNELQYYTPKDVCVRKGMLILRSQKRSMGKRDYTSGLVESKGKFAQKYGRFEIRAKLPKGKGIWPAHWLLPEDSRWPPEIDIMELLGDRPNVVYGALHWGEWPQNRHSSCRYIGSDYSKNFHVFAIEWAAEEIIWYVDGEKSFSLSNNIPQEPFYIILNTAVGGNWPGNPDETTVFPQYHYIDYVRVYAKEVPGKYFLTIFAKNGKVLIEPKQDMYDKGSEISLLAQPILGYKFDSWSKDIAGIENPIKVVMDKHRKINANFVIDPDAPKALSRKKIVKASSIEGASFMPKNVVDGNPKTRWSSDFSDPQWIYVDLGTVYSIEAVKLYWENAYATKYSIEVSDDALNWKTVYSTNKGKGGTEEILNLDVSARYVRMHGEARKREWGYSLWEFEVYGREEN